MAVTRTGKTPKKAARAAVRPHEHALDVALSPPVEKAVASAVRGLSARQRERVFEAVEMACDDMMLALARAIERNVIANANELLAMLAPEWGRADRWPELRAVLLFLEHLDVPVHRRQLAKVMEKAGGPDLAARWRAETAKGETRGTRSEKRGPGSAGATV